jgi:hypothetical protein
VSSRSIVSDANSQLIAITLMLAVMFVIVAIVLAMLMMLPSLTWEKNEVPAIFQITSISHIDEKTGALNYDSRVVMLHTGLAPFQNDNLMAKFFKNEQPVSCNILTLHGEDFIPTHHFGVQTISGEGCKGTTWLPGERVALDFTDSTFHPDEMVRVEIYDTQTGKIISRHSYRA